MKNLLYILLIILFDFNLQAQDPYFSQFSYAPLLINPALTGYINCDLRTSTNYRNQWSGLTTPFETQLISVDTKFKTGLFTGDRDWMGLGAYVYNFTAGDGNLQKIKVSILTSYNLGLNRDNSTFLSGGLSIGFVHRSIDFTKLRFEDQFDGSGFTGQSGETLQNENINYYDISAGIIFTFQLHDRYRQPTLQSHIGISLDHLNSPNESFYGFYENRIDQIINIHAGTFGIVSDNLLMNIEAWFKSSVNTHEVNHIIFGANLLYPVNEYFSVYGGLWYRYNQSIIPMFGFEMSGWRLLFSYDISVSDLQPGESLEFSLSKTFCFGSKNNKWLPCPSFGSDVNMFRR